LIIVPGDLKREKSGGIKIIAVSVSLYFSACIYGGTGLSEKRENKSYEYERYKNDGG
jgi:hypothetical protein